MSATAEKHFALPKLNDEKVSQDHVLKWWMIVLIVIKLWLVDAQDLLATYTPHDDYLFVRLAKSILNGEWLGAYDQMTLVKGPGYPLFLAFAHHTGLPLLLVQQLLYALICVLAIVAIKPLIKMRWPLMIIFFFLLFNPFTYVYPGTGRAFRFGLSMPLVLALFSCICGVLLRVNRSQVKIFLWTTLTGLVFGYLWYTREEGIWLLPSMALFGLYFLVVDRDFRLSTLLVRSLYLIWIVIIFVGYQSNFSYLNQKHYGAPHIVELKSPEFQAALGGLMNMNSQIALRYIPVSMESQEDAYRVSPTFRELKPYFEEHAKGRSLPKSFYIWTLRDIVANSGHSDSLTESLEFYGKIGEEIRLACEAGTIECLDRKPSIKPIWKVEYFELVPKYFWEIFQQAFTFSFYIADENVYARNFSNGTDDMVDDYRFVTRESLAPRSLVEMFSYPKQAWKLKIERFRIFTDLAYGYKAVISVLFWLAVVVHVFFALQSIMRKTFSFELVSSCIVLGGIISLVSVLTYVKITLWSITRPLVSAYPLILLYVSMALVFMINYLIAKRDLAREGMGE